MRIESARDLKAELREALLAGLPRGAAAAAAFGSPAGSLDALDRLQPAIALGVVPGEGDGCRLAVRVQRGLLTGHPVIDEIRRAACHEVDVRFVGAVGKQVRAAFLRGRRRPLLIGSSIAHNAVTAGTLGAVVELGRTGDPRLLSCNHVLANENRASRGDNILQPGPIDGGRAPRDAVATLGRFAPLRRGLNLIDAALAVPRAGLDLDAVKLTGSGRLMGVREAPLSPGLGVTKIGRQTALTNGRITAVELDGLVVSYETGNLRFDDQIEIEGVGPGPFSRGGDSGALVYTTVGRRAVGLLFAGSQFGGANGMGLTYANPIGRVLGSLAVRLAV